MHRDGTACAPCGVDGDLAQALWTLLLCSVRGWLAPRARDKDIHGLNDEEENGCREQEGGDDGVDVRAVPILLPLIAQASAEKSEVPKNAASNGVMMSVTSDVTTARNADADADADGEVDDISSQQELLEFRARSKPPVGSFSQGGQYALGRSGSQCHPWHLHHAIGRTTHVAAPAGRRRNLDLGAQPKSAIPQETVELRTSLARL